MNQRTDHASHYLDTLKGLPCRFLHAGYQVPVDHQSLLKQLLLDHLVSLYHGRHRAGIHASPGILRQRTRSLVATLELLRLLRSKGVPIRWRRGVRAVRVGWLVLHLRHHVLITHKLLLRQLIESVCLGVVWKSERLGIWVVRTQNTWLLRCSRSWCLILISIELLSYSRFFSSDLLVELSWLESVGSFLHQVRKLIKVRIGRNKSSLSRCLGFILRFCHLLRVGLPIGSILLP